MGDIPILLVDDKVLTESGGLDEVGRAGTLVQATD